MNQNFAVPERQVQEDHAPTPFDLGLTASVSTDAGKVVVCTKYYTAQSFSWELLTCALVWLFLVKLPQLQSAAELC